MMKLLFLSILVFVLTYQASCFDFYRRDAQCLREYQKCKKVIEGAKRAKANNNNAAEAKKVCVKLIDGCSTFSKIPSAQSCGSDTAKKSGPTLRRMIAQCQSVVH